MTIDNYTAVVFVHGIGRHVRGDNLGELLTELERISHDDAEQDGILREFKANVELANVGRGKNYLPYMSFSQYKRRHIQWRLKRRYRAYEINWSQQAAVQVPLLSLIWWLLCQFLSMTGVSRDWRKNYQIRVARLHKLADTDTEVAAILPSLLAHYRGFRGAKGKIFENENDCAARVGSLDNFTEYMASREGQNNAFIGKLERGARSWDNSVLGFERAMVRTRVVVVAALIGILAFLYHTIVPAFQQVREGISFLPLSLFMNLHGLSAAVLTILTIAMLLAAGYSYKFLTKQLSDIRIWSSSQEFDHYYSNRERILSEAANTIEHILADSKCTRMVLVTHSLGSAIAYDAVKLLSLANRSSSRGQKQVIRLSKITDLITLGSPIDKVAMLFEFANMKSYRAELLQAELRGDLSYEPFSRPPGVKWWNFWDEADWVSDTLFTPYGTKVTDHKYVGGMIRNFMVVNTRTYRPVASHVRYLKNQKVSEAIYYIIVRGLSGVTPDLPRPAALRMRKASKYCLIAALLFFVFTWLSLFLFSALPYWILPYIPYPWAILSACVAMAWFWDRLGD